MGHRCCSKQKVKRGLWSPEEDERLSTHIITYGHGSWSSVPKLAGLQRCGKSCRLRWINYLRPDLKKGSFTQEEEQIIIDVHRILGNRWAQIAKHLPGRTDNEVKNFWNSCIKKKLISQGLDPQTHNLLSSSSSSSSSLSASTKNNLTNTFVVSHESRHDQEPPSVFSISTGSSNDIITTKTIDNHNNVDDHDVHQDRPFQLTLPMINNNNNNNHQLSFRNYNGTSITPNVSSSSNSSSCFADHDFSGWGYSGFESFDHHETPIRPVVMDDIDNNINNVGKDKIVSEFAEQSDRTSAVIEKNSASSFDLGFLESALMSDNVCHDLDSLEYDLSWDY